MKHNMYTKRYIKPKEKYLNCGKQNSEDNFPQVPTPELFTET